MCRLLVCLIFIVFFQPMLVLSKSAVVKMSVDTQKETAIIKDGVYANGFNCNEILDSEKTVKQLKDVGVKYYRVNFLSPSELCGKFYGDWQWNYPVNIPYELHRQPNENDRYETIVKKVIEKGFEPVIPIDFTRNLPKWFYGEQSDKNGKPWWNFNTDGTPGDGQLKQASQIYADIIKHFNKDLGLKITYWETFGEGYPHPSIMAKMHYMFAKAMKGIDPNIKIIAAETWPGWTIETFAKELLSMPDADEYIDVFSMNWYGGLSLNNNPLIDFDFLKNPINMDNTKCIDMIIQVPPNYGIWINSLRDVLNTPELNSKGKKFQIWFTEFNTTPYAYNWDKITKDWGDFMINCNYYGGIYNASVYCHVMENNGDVAISFTSLGYYGLFGGPETNFNPYPSWYAQYMLYNIAEFKPGRCLLATKNKSPKDGGANVGGKNSPWLEIYASHTPEKNEYSLVLINRNRIQIYDTEILLDKLKTDVGDRFEITKYVYDKTRVASYINPLKFGDGFDQNFKTICIEPVSTSSVMIKKKEPFKINITCEPFSMNILRIKKEDIFPGYTPDLKKK